LSRIEPHLTGPEPAERRLLLQFTCPHSEIVQFRDSLLEHLAECIRLLSRVTCGTERILDLARREPGEELADPPDIRARNVPAYPPEPQAARKFLGIDCKDPGLARRHAEIYILRMDSTYEPGPAIRVKIALG
jgi:hypothetical protein